MYHFSAALEMEYQFKWKKKNLQLTFPHLEKKKKNQP